MKRQLLGASALTFLCVASSAHAADLDAYVPETSASPHFDWAGPYVGAHAGWAWAQTKGVFDISELDEGFEDGSETTFLDDLDANGLMGGFQAGYNFQSGSFVFGPEIDVSFADISDQVGDNENNDLASVDINLLASLRARAGIAFDRLLVYATGGIAYANGDFKLTDDNGLDEENSGSVGIDAWGGVAGGGFEYALTQNVSVRVEGLHYFFNDKQDTSDLTDDSDDGDYAELEGVTVVRAGLNFGF